MSFDSHVLNVLAVATRLVNVLTVAEAHGRPYEPPSGVAVVRAVRDALTTEGRPRPRVTADDARVLAATAEELKAVFAMMAADRPDQAAAAVNSLLRRFGARPQLDVDPTSEARGGFQLHFHGRDDGLAVGWSAGLAAGLAIVIGSDLAGRLGICAAPTCDHVFVDSSRNNQRRFCSTACQNRVKAAAFRSRRRA